MTQIRVIVVSPEEAQNGIAELWCGDELMAVTILHEGQLHLRIDSRADGLPWLIETTSLALGLAEAAQQLATWTRGRGSVPPGPVGVVEAPNDDREAVVL